MEEHDLCLIDGDGMDRVREVGVLDGEVRGDRGDVEGGGVIVLVSERCVVAEAISVIEERPADLHRLRFRGAHAFLIAGKDH